MKRKGRERELKKEGPKYLDASRDGFVVSFALYCCRFSCCVYTEKKPEREEEEHLAVALFSKWAIWLLMGAY